MNDLGAAGEWVGLVRAAVLGTDRHPPPAPQPGWDRWATASDPAVQVLDRAAAVTVARRAGARPVPAVAAQVPAAPVDRRRPCPASCRARLGALLGGEHDVLLGEWLALAAAHDVQLPWELLPRLLLRGRSRPDLDHAVRRLAAGRDAWLATVVPSLGVRTRPAAPAPAGVLQRPVPPPDSRAVVAGIVAAVADGTATWAAAPQLVALVTCIAGDTLDELLVGLAELACPPTSERVRIELADLASARRAMLHEFAALVTHPHVVPTDPAAAPATDPISTEPILKDDRGACDEPC